MLKKTFKIVLKTIRIVILMSLFSGSIFDYLNSYIKVDALESGGGNGYVILNEVVALDSGQNITNFKQYVVILEDGSILKKPAPKKAETAENLQTSQISKINQKPKQSKEQPKENKKATQGTTQGASQVNITKEKQTGKDIQKDAQKDIQTDPQISENPKKQTQEQPKEQTKYSDLSIEQVKDLIKKYSQKYEIDPEIPLKIADCESGFKTNLIGSGKYVGVFQLSKPTFDEFSQNLNFQNPDINNPEQNIELGVYIISEGQAWRWGCK